jgi:hypothetical protein
MHPRLAVITNMAHAWQRRIRECYLNAAIQRCRRSSAQPPLSRCLSCADVLRVAAARMTFSGQPRRVTAIR